MKNYLLFMRVIFLLIAEIGNWKTKKPFMMKNYGDQLE